MAKALGTQEGICAETEPPLEMKANGHLVACHFARSDKATEKSIEESPAVITYDEQGPETASA